MWRKLLMMLAVCCCLLWACAAAEGVKAGDIITFGHYPQTAEGDDDTPIEWVVLEVQGNKALVISRYGLDAKPYNTDYAAVTWETCSLRLWLNGEFMGRAFTAAEQDAILVTLVDNSMDQGYWVTNGGSNTRDKAFLLSWTEVHRYFGVNYWEEDKPKGYPNTYARLQPTAYAIKQHGWTSSEFTTADGAASGTWWLRSPGGFATTAITVEPFGSSSTLRVNYEYPLIRPVMWLDMTAAGVQGE